MEIIGQESIPILKDMDNDIILANVDPMADTGEKPGM